jgi:PhzF family phenazine biosynthesis protein
MPRGAGAGSRSESVPRSIPIRQVDAFTARPFDGNPAGVVLEADGLSDLDMRRIAREMNVAETAFVSQPDGPGTTPRLRWFTPTGYEVAFCGHATVATVHALKESGGLRGDHIVFDTAGGPLAVRVGPGGGRTLIWLEPRLPACTTYTGPLAEVLGALGLDRLGEWATPALTSESDLLLPLPGLAPLHGLRPDPSPLARAALDRKLRGICAVALEGVEPGSRTHSRFFAPHLGIAEDPVTGSVHAALPLWLRAAGRLGGDAEVIRFTAEQGDAVGRPGRLALELYLERGQPARVRVGGEAVTTLTGTLRLD